jgi:RNA polymerase sigma-70 factor (ECF subfamily)
MERRINLKGFEDIYAKNKDYVFKFICKLTSYQENISEELLQETFYQAFISFGRFRGDSEIKTWLCQIAKNTYYRHLRNERKKEKLTNKICCEEAGNDCSKQAEKKELLLLIHKIMEDFDERTRSIVIYRMYADLKFSEIAVILGIKEATAKVIFSRAKVKIQIQLKERFGYEV